MNNNTARKELRKEFMNKAQLKKIEIVLQSYNNTTNSNNNTGGLPSYLMNTNNTNMNNNSNSVRY